MTASVLTLRSVALRSLRCYSMLPQPSSHVEGSRKDVWSLVNEAAAVVEKEQGRPVVNLGQGFFSYSPPDFALEAVKHAIDQPAFNQYAPTRGRPQLLQAIAKSYGPFYKSALDIDLDPASNVLVTSGANEGMFSALTAFLNPGDEAIVFEPFFDQYVHNIKLPGGKVVYVPLHPPAESETEIVSANDWKIDFDELEQAITARTRVIILNSPHNPVGKVLSKEELLRIGDLAEKHNLLILSDEVYDRLHYSEFTRVATLSKELWNRTLTVGSAGKLFAATGWRIGWLIGPAPLINASALANTRICFSANSPMQIATAEAFDKAEHNGYFEETIEKFKARFARFTKVFDELGLPYTTADGGYFLLVNFSKVKIPADYKFPDELLERPLDFRLAHWLIKEFGVVAIPPTEFVTDKHAKVFEKFLRFAVCKDDALLDEASLRLRGLSKYIQ